MRLNRNYLTAVFDKTKIFFADSPSGNGHYLRTRILGLVKHRLCYRSKLKLKLSPLHRRFPVEQEQWDILLRNAPEKREELLRNRNSDLLIWIKADKSNKRFKYSALSAGEPAETYSPLDIAIKELEPIPVDKVEHYTPLLALFTLAQLPVPAAENKQQRLAYSARVRELSVYLDQTISNPPENMPANFIFILRRFQAWAWSIVGIVSEDTAKIGRAIRAYQTLITDWQGVKSDLIYGQTLSNLAALKLAQAHLITGMETYEASMDLVSDAQSILSRTRYPILWAQLQELRSEAQISMGERYSDTDSLETSIHTLQTIKRVWNAHNRTSSLAAIQSRIGDVLHILGRIIPGTERLEQATSAYYGALQAYSEISDSQLERTVRLSLAQTLIDLGERAGNKERLQEAITILSGIKTGRRDDKEKLISERLTRAHALTRIGCQYSDQSESENNLQQAISLFSEILKKPENLDIYDRLHSLEFMGMALGQLGKNTGNSSFIKRSSDCYNQALEIIENGAGSGIKKLSVPAQIKGRLYGQLARNYGWQGRSSSDITTLDHASKAYTDAIACTDREKMSRDWATLQSELAENLITASKYKNGQGSDLIDTAVQAYHKSLSALQRERAPLLWAQIKNKLAEALTLSGAMGGGTPCLELAIDSYEKALEEWKPGPSSMERATALNNMANVLADLGRREASGEKLQAAQKAFSEAYDLYSSLGQTSFAERVHDNLSAIMELAANDFQINANKLFSHTKNKAYSYSHT